MVTTTDNIEVHMRAIDKKSYETINELRKARGYSWNEMFRHFAAYDKSLFNILNRDMEDGLCVTKSQQTIMALLPKWCDNMAKNMPDILKTGDIADLVCKTHRENKCKKLSLLKQYLEDKSKEYSKEEVAKLCNIPLQYMDFLLRVVLTYKFVPIAGSDICIGCENRVQFKKPALIIGGGPSLYTNKHLDLLAEHGFDGDIFVVGKVLKDVLDKGITPNYVGAIDAEEADTAFFNHDIVDINSDKITALFGVNIHPTTTHRWKGNKRYFSGYIAEADSPNISHIFHLMTHTSNLSAAGNVGSCMCNVASFLGYNPLVLIGMNLSFPSIADMKSYFPLATEEDWKRQVNIGGKLRPMYKRGYNLYGQQYYYDTVFESYVESHKSWAKSLLDTGVQTINCTEGGALYGKQITPMKFEDYLLSQKK